MKMPWGYKLNRIGFVMMESIYPQRGGVHEQVYLLSKELINLQKKVDILAYSTRRAEESGKRLLWLRQLEPRFLNRLLKAKEEVYIAETAWPIVPTLVAARINGSRCVLHLHSVESFQDVGLGRFPKALVKFLEWIGKTCDVILVPSEVEFEILHNNKVKILRNVIDVESFETREPMRLQRPAVVFVGGMGYPPNREAAEIVVKISEEVNRRRRVYFYLVGPSPPPVKFPVIATGYVNSTIPYILGADICIAPLMRGGGVKLKILEYMASGKPIVASRKAVEGIQGVKYVHAETVEEFVNAILDILENKVDVEDFKHENPKIIERDHSPKNSARRLLNIIS